MCTDSHLVKHVSIDTMECQGVRCSGFLFWFVLFLPSFRDNY